jgi:hypothetical protein
MGHRTALVAAGSIAAVIFAAAVAVGANLGILNAADSRPVGNLSASAAVKVVGAQPDAAQTTPQKYVIRKAGTVSVAVMKSGLRLVDVTTRPGWRWTLEQTANRRLRVTFKSGSTIYRFLTVMRRHGRIMARVDHPVTKVVPYAATAVAVVQSPTTQYVTPVSRSAATTGQQASPASAPAPASNGGDDQSQGGGADD